VCLADPGVASNHSRRETCTEGETPMFKVTTWNVEMPAEGRQADLTVGFVSEQHAAHLEDLRL
jgi:hypothetical protein